jgi:anaerobic selenocysteine-containing dehydrogenase
MTQLGVEPGDEVRVRSPRGELVVAAVGDGGVPSGVALLQFNAAPVHETSASALIDSSVAVVEVDVEKVT